MQRPNPVRKPHVPIALGNMVDVVESALQREGAAPETAEKHALAAVISIAEYFGRSTVYIPSVDQLKRFLRDREIYAEAGKLTVEEIAKKHGLSGVRVYQILDAMRSPPHQGEVISPVHTSFSRPGESSKRNRD